MASYSELPDVWHLTNPDSAHPGEQEFFEILQKQFPPVQTNGGISDFPIFMDGVNPQNLSLFSLSNLTPSSTSEDSSSPSPPTTHQEAPQDGNADDPTLKRKASTNKLESEPNNKAQHTASTDKRAATGARRKSSGQNGRDEQRLIKRKEQNRAAQRAFRERKEKHVKDLEDQVADLEAKNEAAQHENENLRDMLNRLQSENMTLKQSTFTFSVPKDSTNASDNTLPSNPVYSPISPAQSVSSSSTTLPASPKPTNPLEWSSLTTFDPNVLNLLDDNISQSTATDNAMRMDFGFGNTQSTANPPITIIANNPMFTTTAFDFPAPGELNVAGAGSSFNNGGGSTSNSVNPFNFDLNPLTSWQPSTPFNTSVPDPIFDDLFRGYLSSLALPDLMSFTGSTPSISPIAHHASPSVSSRLLSAPSSSPSILAQEPLFTRATSTDADTSVTQSPESSQIPRSREECREKIAQEGNSMFAPPIQKDHDQMLGTMIRCAGSSFPKTEKNDKNIEVLTALKNIRSDPKFKDVDITELCHQFTNKACCDGTKVVVEPAAVSEIMDNLAKSRSH